MSGPGEFSSVLLILGVLFLIGFGAALDIICKDVDLALNEGESLGVPMQVCQGVRQFLRTARAINGGRADITTVAKLVGEWAGKEIPKTR